MALLGQGIVCDNTKSLYLMDFMFVHMDWLCFGCTEPEPEPPELVHFARSRSRGRCKILLPICPGAVPNLYGSAVHIPASHHFGRNWIE